MLSGKAFARSIRAHFLAQSVLFSVILNTLIAKNKIDLSPSKDVYEKAVNGIPEENELNQYCQSESFKSVKNCYALPTVHRIHIVNEFIFSERTPNWYFHIDSMKQ